MTSKKMEDDLKKNGRQPHKKKWKTTSQNKRKMNQSTQINWLRHNLPS